MKKIVLIVLTIVMLTLGVVGMMQATAGSPPADDGVCPDLTGNGGQPDGAVRVNDIIYVVQRYFTADPLADLNANGQVGVDDILRVVMNYFETCTYPTPVSTPFNFGSAGGPVPPGYATFKDYANDWFDDHSLNYSGGAGGGTAGEGIWINVGCSVSSAPDCVVPNNSRIIIHADDSVEVIMPTPEAP